MALVRVDVKPSERDPPEPIASFLRAANERVERFRARRRKHPIAAFVPSDFELAWRMLDAIARHRLAPGNAFCEWGCGIAAVAGLASLAGFDACGIEVERELVAEAQGLVSDHALAVEIVHGSFVPPEAGPLIDDAGEFSWIAESGPDGHSALGRDPRDFDLVFAYPWPGEAAVIFRLFDVLAADDALLLTFHGREGLRLDRKTASRSLRRGARHDV